MSPLPTPRAAFAPCAQGKSPHQLFKGLNAIDLECGYRICGNQKRNRWVQRPRRRANNEVSSPSKFQGKEQLAYTTGRRDH